MTKYTIPGLSKTEAEIVARLTYDKKKIVSIKELNDLLPADYPYTRKMVYKLKKKKLLLPVKRGVYIFVPLEAVVTGRRINEFLIPSLFFPNDNYYIGYSSMYNYYNLLEQQFQTVYVLNTSISQTREAAGAVFKFIKIANSRMYGTETIKIENKNVIISSKEKTLIDLVYFNKPAGGLKQALFVLENIVRQKKCDIKKLIDYTALFPNIKTRKQIGLLLDNIGISDTLLKPLIESVSDTSLISFSRSRKGIINKKWNVIINDS